jgi:hypothetical protein
MANMKQRHSAALAVVGWYLMLPPLQFVGPPNDLTAYGPKWARLRRAA